MARLRVTQGNAAGTEIPLEGEFAIGRSAQGAGRLADDPEISRQHARVVDAGGQLAVEDLGSTNGTFVNGTRISGRQPLSPGDEIRVGKTTLVVEGEERTVVGAPVPGPAPAPGPAPTPGPPTAPVSPEAPPTAQVPPQAPPTAQLPPQAPAPGPQGPPPQPGGYPGAGVPGPPYGGQPDGPYAGAPPDTGPGNGKAVAALVLGILAILASWAGIGLIFAIVAIVLGVAGKRAVDRGRTRKNRGLAQAGFILGIIGVPLSLILSGLLGYGVWFALRETENVNEALLAYVEARDDGDAGAICDQLTDEGQDDFVERVSIGGAQYADCEEAAGTLAQVLPSVDEEGRNTLEDGDAEVEFDGTDRATIEQDPGGGEWEFEKDGGDWKISKLPPIPGE